MEDFTENADVAVVGHVGVGHVHSHSGFIQDDSAGFAVVCSLFKQFFPANTNVLAVDIKENSVIVTTVDGGRGQAEARRGFTLWERNLMRNSIGHDALFSQSLACYCYGRMYGQGVMESAVAFQTALCLAVVDTFITKYTSKFLISSEGIEGNVGCCLATKVNLYGIGVALMAVINATKGGIGPAEDNEGNVCLGEKGVLMKKLGMLVLPTIVVESKAFIPSLKTDIENDLFICRYNKEFDNPVVGASILKASQDLNIPLLTFEDSYPRNSNDIEIATYNLGRKIELLGQQLKHTNSAFIKCKIVAELAQIVSEDAGGVSYMSNDIFAHVAGGGLLPGTAAVLSLMVCEESIKKERIPCINSEDIIKYISLIVSSVKEIYLNKKEAQDYLNRINIFPDLKKMF